MKGFNGKITECIAIFIFRDAESAVMFRYSTAVQWQYSSSVTVQQFRYSTAVQSQYCSSVTVVQLQYSSSVTVQQFSHSTAVHSTAVQSQYCSYSTAVQSQCCSSVTVLQFSHSTAVQSQYSSSVTVQQFTVMQFSHSNAGQSRYGRSVTVRQSSHGTAVQSRYSSSVTVQQFSYGTAQFSKVRPVLFFPATVNRHVNALFDWNWFWPLGYPWRYKHYANAPHCYVLRSLLILFLFTTTQNLFCLFRAALFPLCDHAASSWLH